MIEGQDHIDESLPAARQRKEGKGSGEWTRAVTHVHSPEKGVPHALAWFAERSNRAATQLEGRGACLHFLIEAPRQFLIQTCEPACSSMKWERDSWVHGQEAEQAMQRCPGCLSHAHMRKPRRCRARHTPRRLRSLETRSAWGRQRRKWMARGCFKQPALSGQQRQRTWRAQEGL
jgi:hypothetical protein